jgi:hypothetical protein
MRNRREFELPFVPTVVLGAVLLTWAMGAVLTSQSHPADASRSLKSLGGDLIGSRLYLYDDSLPKSQVAHMLWLAERVHGHVNPGGESVDIHWVNSRKLQTDPQNQPPAVHLGPLDLE